MKKNYILTIGLSLVVAFASAQPAFLKNNSEVKYPVNFDQNAFPVNSITEASNAKTTGAVNVAWFSDAYYLVTQNQYINGSVLFPDTNAFIKYNNVNYRPVTMQLSAIMDWTSFSTSPELQGWNSTDPVTVDSMYVAHIYSRNTAANIVDTLIVDVFYSDVPFQGEIPVVGYTGAKPYALTSDTVWYKSFAYDPAIDGPKSTTKITTKVLLTAADAASGSNIKVKYFALPNTLMVPGSSVIGATVKFKPGYTYTPTDDIGTKNNFIFASTEGSGSGTYPMYLSCNAANGNCTWTSSGTLRSYDKYNTQYAFKPLAGQGNTDVFYVSTNAYFVANAAASLVQERHFIGFKIANTNINGIADLTKAGIVLGQNVPNPTNGTTTINYSLTNSSAVSFVVYDVTGKQVMNLNEGVKQAGSHSISFDVKRLEKGVYFYSMNAGGQQLTKYMIINE